MSSPPTAQLDLSALVNNARQHISILSQSIGPRPAGSSAERQAIDYISGLFEEWGYKLERQSIAFAPPPRVSLPVIIGAIAMGLSGWVIRPAPWLAIWLPLLFMILPQWTRAWLKRRKPTQYSENLFARFNIETSTPPELILCAHVDSGASVPLRSQTLLKLYSRGMDILQRIAWMIAALCVLQLLGWTTADFIVYPVAVLSSLGGIALATPQLLRLPVPSDTDGINPPQTHSPGANDNASGVGVLLALAKALSLKNNNPRVAFLFTGAEETGLFGAQAFAMSHENWKENTLIICVDMVGTGNNLYYVVKEGVFFPIYTSERVNELVKRANQDIKPIWYTLRSGDYAAFCQAGFQASSLQCGGKDLADWTYHSLYDTNERIDTKALENTLKTLIQAIGGFGVVEDFTLEA